MEEKRRDESNVLCLGQLDEKKEIIQVVNEIRTFFANSTVSHSVHCTGPSRRQSVGQLISINGVIDVSLYVIAHFSMNLFGFFD